MKTDLVEYLSDAIARTAAGGIASPSGSWLAGVFGRAANLFEREFSSHLAGLLKTSGLTYPGDLDAAVKGTPSYEKLTLGQLVAVMREAGRRRPDIGGRHLPRFLDDILTVNATWVKTKHGDDVDEKILLARMKTMLKLAKLLRGTSSAAGTPNLQMQRTAPERRR